jgi:Uncharacterised nucleotidyltransferase
LSRSREQQQILFLLAGCARRRRSLSRAARAQLERADFDQLARDLAERRLLPLIGTRAIEAAPELIPERFRDAVASATAAARARGLLVETATKRLLALLEDRDIRALAIKGAPLALDGHGDLGLRETADVDLLVSVESLDDAVRALVSAGYAADTGPRRPNGLPDLHYELRHETLPSVDLHWRAYWYESAFSARLLSSATRGADGMLRPLPPDLMTSLLLYYARDGFHGVRLAADIGAWWDRHGDSLSAGFLAGYTERFPQLRDPLTAAALVAEQVAGVPGRDWLGPDVDLSPRVSRAVRLADWAQTADRDQMSANISLVAALLRPSGSLGEFARRELVLEDGGALASAVHTAKLAGRCGIALWKVRGSRRWAEPPASAEAVPVA